MQELEKIKGTDSVAGGLMKSDRNFTRLKLEVENIDVSDEIDAHNTDDTSHENIIGLLSSLTTDEKANLVASINEVKTQSNDIETQLAKVTYDNAGAHNSIFRGKYLGSSVTAEQYANIQNGTFKDMYIGDYWTINGTDYVIVAFNYYTGTGDSLVPGNHITLVPRYALYNHAMNDTAITTGGYTGSKMYTEGLAQARTKIKADFSGHVIKHRQLLCNATTDGKASGWAWYDSEVELMNEHMVYGGSVWGESTIGSNGYNVGVGKTQLPLFRFRPDMISMRTYNIWLRDVVSAAGFANVYYDGYATNGSASLARGVRPAFSIS